MMFGTPGLSLPAFVLFATSLPASDPGDLRTREEFTLEDARHLLMRAGLGGTPEEVQRLHRLGLEGMVSWLVDYEKRPEVGEPFEMVPVRRPDFRKLRAMSEEERRAAIQELRREDQRAFGLLRTWWMQRMLRTRRPLEEKMTLFWHGHFTSSYREVRSAFLLSLQNHSLRTHATGNFGELLHEISKDPAMLLYLNNNQNRKGRANENFAREVMELFTLGHGNYREKDIEEAARAFTGWQVGRRQASFRFNPSQHDEGMKTFLGLQGRLGGEEVLDHLLAQEACAPFLAEKIFAYFAYEDPEPELVKELGDFLRSVGYEIKPLLRRIFTSRAFYSDRARGAKVKSPLLLMVSTTRMLGLNEPPPRFLLAAADQLGQSLLMPPNVEGWEGGLSWITTATLLDRYNFCGVLVKAGDPESFAEMAREIAARGGARGGAGGLLRALRQWESGFSAIGLARVAGARDPVKLVDAFCRRLLFTELPKDRRRALEDFVSGRDGSTPLDFGNLDAPGTETKLRKLIHLIMSTPEFQVC